ncbi:lysophosphatidylserine lipase ABHD12 [Diabrotica virgifera virgifera]|uniref:Serine aminopeptidase S33 domain-containing protein n=1 Tax=Diabrotica virgifera virgifera TaxID=50390 RepID=A0ABM5IIU1_DIAVI|nr:lysophosphatidylserine lipase ABHD12 [Diabrotica virgifera virgifera]
MTRHGRFQDYCLVHDNDADEIDLLPDFRKPRCRYKRCICITITLCVVLALIAFMLVFIVFPFVFMNSIPLQTSLIFTRFNLPRNPEYFENQHFPAYRNRYVSFNYTKDEGSKLLGVWHILPVNLAYEDLYDNATDINYDEILLNSNYSVLLYFHGTGEVRSYSERKYELLSYNFQIIAFDYRGYGDSSDGELTEDTVVEDCVELYKWVRNRTKSDIYVWGHSLGAALATRTVAEMENYYNVHTKALVLESGFTSMRDELYVHPYGKLFAWLPWFDTVVVEPLMHNGFVFNTTKHLKTITCPVMILHAQDDNEIPYYFGRRLADIAESRNITTVYHEFDAMFGYKHYYLYQDPFMKFYIMNLIEQVNSKRIIEGNNTTMVPSVGTTV